MSVNLHSFRGCAGIAGNGVGLGEEAEFEKLNYR